MTKIPKSQAFVKTCQLHAKTRYFENASAARRCLEIGRHARSEFLN
jgi:hypothetical protein